MRRYSRFTFIENTIAICLKSAEPSFWEAMNLFVLLAYASLAASRTLLQQLLTYLKFPLDSEDSFCWYKQKKRISINYGSSTRSWKPWKWVRIDLQLTMTDIYIISNQIPHTKFTSSSSRSTKFKDIFPWNISQMIAKTAQSAWK